MDWLWRDGEHQRPGAGDGRNRMEKTPASYRPGSTAIQGPENGTQDGEFCASAFLFDHLPKTGGTAFRVILEHLFGDSNVSPWVSGRPERWAASTYSKYRVISGHFTSPLPKGSYSRGRARITLLRNPIERILSEYFFYRNNPISAQGNRLVSLARENDLRTYVEFLAEKHDAAICNFYVRHFVRQISRRPLCDKTKLHFAKQALTRYDFVGIQEHFVDSVDMFCCQFALRPVVDVPRVNVTVSRRSAFEIDEQSRQRLTDLNRLDLELYDFAVQAFLAKKRAIFHKAAAGSATPMPGNGRQTEPPQTAQDPRPETFGNELVRIQSVSIAGVDPSTNAVRSGDNVTILIEVAADIDVPSLTVGLEISDEIGEIVYGTNTYVLRASQQVRSGRRYIVSFTFAANLRDGRYHVSVALHTGDSHEECCFHWRDEAASFCITTGFGTDFVGYCRLSPAVEWASGS